jgi:hypothetical protein
MDLLKGECISRTLYSFQFAALRNRYVIILLSFRTSAEDLFIYVKPEVL